MEGSLLKSRLVTNRWLGQVSKKKRDLEERMFKLGDSETMMPYMEYSITSGGGYGFDGQQAASSQRKAQLSSVMSDQRRERTFSSQRGSNFANNQRGQ